MPRQATYFLGRTTLSGQVTKSGVIDCLLAAPIITVNKYSWTVTDATVSRAADGEVNYVFGRLAKFQSIGEINTIDTAQRREVDAKINNLIIASSPFVYIPSESGVAYQHIWNYIQQETFVRRLEELVQAKYGYMFAGFEIVAITDHAEFWRKLSRLDRIDRIRARIYPPNPLFGHLWESLRDYMKSRRSAEIRHEEVAASESGLNSQLPRIVAMLAAEESVEDVKPPPLGDAALLMASDGYGEGVVEGNDSETDATIVIRTSETIRNFRYTTEPEPELLYAEAAKQFKRINAKRNLKHQD